MEKKIWGYMFITFLFVCLLSSRQVMAASHLAGSSSYWANGIKEDEHSLEEVEEEYAEAVMLTDGLEEEVKREFRKYRYTAEEDVTFTMWTSDANYDSDIRMSVIHSNGLCGRWREELPEFSTFLKKGETVYIDVFEVLKPKEAQFTINCSIKPAKKIRSFSVQRPPILEGYVESEDYLDMLHCVAGRLVVELEYEDGERESLSAGSDFAWEYEILKEGKTPGDYPFTVYYRGQKMDFVYSLKLLETKACSKQSISVGEKAKVVYRENQFALYTFIPPESGYYCMFGEEDQWNKQCSTDIIIYEKDSGRTVVNDISRNVSNYHLIEDMYLLKGVLYQIFIRLEDPNSYACFSMERGLEPQEEGVEAEALRYYWYTGKEIYPKPTLSYFGQSVEIDYYIQYEYLHNTAPGEAVVIIQYKFTDQDGRKHEGKLACPFAIKQHFENVEVLLEADSYVYTGSEIIPKEAVFWGGKQLVRNEDYTVELSNNKNAGTAVMKLKGIGRYAGSIIKSFRIEKRCQKIEMADTFIKTKSSRDFSIHVKRTGGKVTYTGGNRKVATVNKKGRVQIKGYGKTSVRIGMAETKNDKAASKKITIIVTSRTGKIQSVKSSVKKKAVVKLKKVSDAEGYEISYCTDKGFNAGVKTATTDRLTKTIKGLKSKETYYIRVRTYRTVRGKRLYSAYSPVKKIKIK